MSDLLNDLNKILKKDLGPILIKYLKDPNNKITDNINDFLSDPRILLTDILEKFSKNDDNFQNKVDYTEIENITDVETSSENEYDDLLRRLILIEDNLIKIDKLLKDKN